MLLKPGLKSVAGPFNWVRLPVRLAEFGAIRQSLVNRRAAVLVYEIAHRRCAASNESMLAVVMTSMVSFVATRVTSTPDGAAASMPSPPSALLLAQIQPWNRRQRLCR